MFIRKEVYWPIRFIVFIKNEDFTENVVLTLWD